MHMRNLLPLAAASFLLSSVAAMADDAPVINWGGFYVGAIANVDFSHTHFALPGDLHDVLQQTHDDRSSFAAGGLAGFNWQDGNTVFGIDGDITSGNGTASVTACTKIDGCFTSAHDSFTTLNYLKTNWSGRLRARVGWTTGDTLFYGAAGYSIAGTRLSLVGLCYDPLNPPVPMVFNFDRSRTLSGFNLGAGIEHQLDEHFTLRAEYVFEDFGGNIYKGAAPEWNDRDISIRNSALRVGVAYRL